VAACDIHVHSLTVERLYTFLHHFTTLQVMNKVAFVTALFICQQEAQLSRRGCAMPRVTEYFATGVTQDHWK